MAVYTKPSSIIGSYFAKKIVIALSLPLESSLLKLVTTFPFNVILALTAVLIVGIIRIFTKKPRRLTSLLVDAESQPAHETAVEVSKLVPGTNLKRHMQMGEEEMPRSFKGDKDGIVKLYDWFYRYARWKLEGISDNMTPREFMSVVSGKVPPQGALPLEYLVTSFEIVTYSKITPTREMQSKCLNSVEVLKDLVESGDSRLSDDVNDADERSLELVTHDVQMHET